MPCRTMSFFSTFAVDLTADAAVYGLSLLGFFVSGLVVLTGFAGADFVCVSFVFGIVF